MSALSIERKRFSEMDGVNHKNSFTTWLKTLIEEKGIQDREFSVEGESGTNLIPLMVVAEHILIAPKTEQKRIKSTLVQIDFRNGDVCHFFNHLAKAIAT
jgi:hypothetical protein